MKVSLIILKQIEVEAEAEVEVEVEVTVEVVVIVGEGKARFKPIEGVFSFNSFLDGIFSVWLARICLVMLRRLFLFFFVVRGQYCPVFLVFFVNLCSWK